MQGEEYKEYLYVNETEEDKKKVSHKRQNKIFNVELDENGVLWIATQFQGLYKIDYDVWLKNKELTKYNPFKDIKIRELHEFEGAMWVCGNGGAFLYKDGVCIDSVKNTDGLTDKSLTELKVDQSGLVWICGSSGLNIYEQGAFDYVVVPEAQYTSYDFIGRFDDERLIIGNRNDIYRVEKDFSNSELIMDAPVSQLVGFVQDEFGDYWFGMKGMGVISSRMGDKKNHLIKKWNYSNIRSWKLSESYFHYYTYNKHGDNGYTSDMAMDQNGIVWSSAEGIFKYEKDTILIYNEKQGLATSETNALAIDHNNILWVGTQKGLYCLNNESQRFEAIPEFINQDISDIYVDSRNYIWIGVGLQGLYKIDSENKYILNAYDKSNGLNHLLIESIVEDKQKNIWIGTDRGIYKIDPNCESAKNNCLKYYGLAEGFIAPHCNKNAVFCDQDGRIWWGTSKNVTIYDPKDDFEIESIPILNWKAIELSSDPRSWKELRADVEGIAFSNLAPWTKFPENLILPYQENNLTITYSCIDWRSIGKIKYQYKLQNEAEWSQLSFNNQVSISGLQAGIYNFQVRCTNNNGLTFSNIISYNFKISPPFWKRIWFFILMGLIIIIIAFIFIKIREKNLRTRQLLLQKEVVRRTEELITEKNKVEIKNEEIEKKNISITESINYAKRIQEAILPKKSVIDKSIPNSFIYYRPKDIVSGDFYWVFDAPDRILFSVIDCTGHGVPGALMSIIGHSMLEKVVKEYGLLKPSFILNALSKEVARALNQSTGEANHMDVKDGMDLAICSINKNNHTLEFAGAYNPLYLIRNGQIIEIKGDRLQIGRLNYTLGESYENHDMELMEGDTIYLFTDGYVDQKGGPKKKKFYYQPFRELLLRIHLLPMDEQKDILDEQLNDWKGTIGQTDDICIIGVRI
jgi:serine phosphatase RsbU (regulator of sigma subunit)/ligand-binding sensor domain-containing protein